MRSTGTPPSRRSEGFFLPLALALAASLLFAACSPAARVSIPPDATGSLLPVSTATPIPSPTATPAPTFPISLTNNEGTTVAIPTRPSRIVSLTPATTELLFALGARDRVVAKVEDPANFRPRRERPERGRVRLRRCREDRRTARDLVMAGGGSLQPPRPSARMRSLGIPTVVVYAPTVATVFADIELTGAAVGKWPRPGTWLPRCGPASTGWRGHAIGRQAARVLRDRRDRRHLRPGRRLVPGRDDPTRRRRSHHDGLGQPSSTSRSSA